MRWTPFLINFQTLEAEQKNKAWFQGFQARLTTGSHARVFPVSMPATSDFQFPQDLGSRLKVSLTPTHSCTRVLPRRVKHGVLKKLGRDQRHQSCQQDM
jgi:hypothetical protein